MDATSTTATTLTTATTSTTATRDTGQIPPDKMSDTKNLEEEPQQARSVGKRKSCSSEEEVIPHKKKRKSMVNIIHGILASETRLSAAEICQRMTAQDPTTFR